MLFEAGNKVGNISKSRHKSNLGYGKLFFQNQVGRMFKPQDPDIFTGILICCGFELAIELTSAHVHHND